MVAGHRTKPEGLIQISNPWLIRVKRQVKRRERVSRSINWSMRLRLKIFSSCRCTAT